MKTTSQTITTIIIIISYINLNVRLQQYFLLHSFHFIPQSLLGYWSYGHCYNGVSQEKEEEKKNTSLFLCNRFDSHCPQFNNFIEFSIFVILFRIVLFSCALSLFLCVSVVFLNNICMCIYDTTILSCPVTFTLAH